MQLILLDSGLVFQLFRSRRNNAGTRAGLQFPAATEPGIPPKETLPLLGHGLAWPFGGHRY
jgi:hypothetical protein